MIHARRESYLRKAIVRVLPGAIPVENAVLPGTPDVSYVEGWLELKCRVRWPKRADTIVSMDHFTPQQRVWHLRRAKAGGSTHVLIEFVEACEYLLLEGAEAARILGKTNRAELMAACSRVWSDRKTMLEELPLVLCRNA